MSQFWSSMVHGLTPYVPGEQPKLLQQIKLNTNENPYPPSSQVFSAIQEANNQILRLYPDPNSDALKSALANTYQLNVNQIFVGNGSDEVLAHVFQALLKHDLPILFPDITYSFYPVYCGLYGIDFETIPLSQSFELNVADYTKPNGGIIFPNPNAPTGQALSLAQIRSLLKLNTQSVIVIDEAYVDFGAESAVSLINEFPNLLVVHTFSKSRSLAGLRVGYAMGHADLIAGLERVKNSFNSYPLGRLAQAGAIAALNDVAYFKSTCQKIIDDRQWLVEALEKLGFNVVPSAANFIFVTHPTHDAKQLQMQLRDANVIVRHFNLPRISQFLRITIGTSLECQALVAILTSLINPST